MTPDLPPCDPAWLDPAGLDAWRAAAQAHPWLATTASTWRAGALVLVIEPDAPGASAARALRLDLHEGVLRALEPAAPDAAAPFRLSAPAALWRAILAGQRDPMKAILAGDVTLTGRIAPLAAYVRAAQDLAEAARRAWGLPDPSAKNA